MRKIYLACILSLFFCLLLFSFASAQGEQLQLKLSRDFGYSGFGSDIQGMFTMHVSGPQDLARVDFFIDSNQIGEDTQAPFSLQFNTDNYPLGLHQLSATGYTASDAEYHSNSISVKFVPASEGTKAALRIAVPILVIVFGAMIASAVISIVSGRKTRNLAPGTPRQYPLGGAICPRCGRPFAMQLLGLNLVGGKLERCPYCGKWSVVRRARMEELRQAEQAEIQDAAPQVKEMSEEEKLKQDLNNSKFEGH